MVTIAAPPTAALSDSCWSSALFERLYAILLKAEQDATTRTPPLGGHGQELITCGPFGLPNI